jgi:hypothetical protein
MREQALNKVKTEQMVSEIQIPDKPTQDIHGRKSDTLEELFQKTLFLQKKLNQETIEKKISAKNMKMEMMQEIKKKYFNQNYFKMVLECEFSQSSEII